MQPYKQYLFDADGTLFDTTDLIIRCFINTATVHHLTVPSREAIISHVGLPLRTQMEKYFGILSDELFSQYRNTHMTYQMQIYREHLTLCPGVAEALSKLKAHGKQCAVVTSRMMPTLSLYLQETGIASCFETCITPESTKRHKPDPEPALEAVRRLGGTVSETIFVGDSTFDIECGSRAGCATAFVLWSTTQPESLSCKPDFRINDMRELCDW
jgi:pyrophosphatase PpaX